MMKSNDVVLLNHQREFIESTEKEVIMLGCPASGKTFAQVTDAFVYALKFPRIRQAFISKNPEWMYDNFKRTAESDFGRLENSNKARRIVIFENMSRVEFCHYEDMDRLLSTETSIYRIDLQEMFHIPRTYFDLLNHSRTEQMKITAWDASHRFMTRKGLKVINIEKPHPEFMEYVKMAASEEGNILLRTYLYGEWVEREQPEPRREEPK